MSHRGVMCDIWFAQTLAMLFLIPDFRSILDWPRSLFEDWRARYLLEPWDMDNQRALARVEYKAPKWLTKKGRFLTPAEFRDSVENR